jgi:hypothetical protein
VAVTYRQVLADIRNQNPARVFIDGATIASGEMGAPVQIANLHFVPCPVCSARNPARICYVAKGTRNPSAKWYIAVEDRPDAEVISFGQQGFHNE